MLLGVLLGGAAIGLALLLAQDRAQPLRLELTPGQSAGTGAATEEPEPGGLAAALGSPTPIQSSERDREAALRGRQALDESAAAGIELRIHGAWLPGGPLKHRRLRVTFLEWPLATPAFSGDTWGHVVPGERIRADWQEPGGVAPQARNSGLSGLRYDGKLPAASGNQIPAGLKALESASADWPDASRLWFTDERGALSFEGLQPSLVIIEALGLGFADARQVFALTEDCDYDFIVPAELSFGGQLTGLRDERFELGLVKEGTASYASRNRRTVLDAKGRFLYRGLTPGRYHAYLFDESRWKALKRFPSFELKADWLDAQYAMPQLGSLSLRAHGLPQGFELLGSYLERLEPGDAGERGQLWLNNDQSAADRFSFADIPYGDYELYIRAVSGEISRGRSTGQILESFPVSLGQPHVELDWNYAELPETWLRLSVDWGAAPKPSLEPDAEALGSGSTSLKGSFVVNPNLPDADRVLLESSSKAEVPVRFVASRLFSSASNSDLLEGRLAVRSQARDLLHEQSFLVPWDPESTRGPSSEIHGKRPFDDRRPRVEDGAIELLIPRRSGWMTLSVEVPGFEADELSFELLGSQVLELSLRPLPEPDPESE